jgi:uncharacterized protein YdcH (DUF465 family)
MTLNNDQSSALLKEYADLIKDLKNENADLRDRIFSLEEYIREIEFQFKSSHDKNYDC